MFGPFKKEKPIQGFSGFGGGATGAAFRTSGGGGATSPKGASGGTIITNPDYIYHKFVTADNGTPANEFWAGPEWSTANVQLLLVGGGGGGGCDDYPGNRGGGGGGGGGVYSWGSVPISQGTRVVTVGSGGPGALPNETKNPLGTTPADGEYKGAPGNPSRLGETGGPHNPTNFVAHGGGGGGSHTLFQSVARYTPGSPGQAAQEQGPTHWPTDRQGSGGGGSNGQNGAPGQGEGSPGVGGDYGGGGGGGAAQDTDTGTGGNGEAWSYLPPPYGPQFGAPEGKFGGGGGGRQNTTPDNQGGEGGGGAGHASGNPPGNPGAGTAGTDGLGGGGGASREVQGGEGGDGVVIVRYPA